MKHKFLFILGTFLLLTSVNANSNYDVTEDYDDLVTKIDYLAKDSNSVIDIKELRKYKIFFIGGLFAKEVDLTTPYKQLKKYLGPIFEDHKSILDQYNITYEAILPWTFLSLHENAKLIANKIRNSGDRPVLIISLSRGSLEVLDALIQFEDTREKVKGWIALSSPFRGAWQADKLEKKWFKWFNYATSSTLSIIGATAIYPYKQFIAKPLEQSTFELTTNFRTEYMEKNQSSILELTQTMPIITTGTSNKNSLEEDWLVPFVTSRLPDSEFIHLYSNLPAAICHVTSVVRVKNDGFDRKKMTLAILQMLINKI